MRDDAPPREDRLRDVLAALRWLVPTGGPWGHLPGDFPPCPAVDPRGRRSVAAGVFEAMAHDLRGVIRVAAGRRPGRADDPIRPGERRAGRGRRVRAAERVERPRGRPSDTRWLRLARTATAASGQERPQVADPAAAVQEATGPTGTLAAVAPGYTGDRPAADAAADGIAPEVVRRAAAERGVALLPRRWVAERSFGWRV